MWLRAVVWGAALPVCGSGILVSWRRVKEISVTSLYSRHSYDPDCECQDYERARDDFYEAELQ